MNPSNPKRKTKRWWLRLVLLATAGVALQYSINRALRVDEIRLFLLARLEHAFGRPVKAGQFSLAVFPEPSLVVSSVSVTEDPRFGHEYFVRAEQLTASLRWSALFSGRLEFDTVSFERPSLNLVRIPDGQWNLESWLPPLPGSAPAAAGAFRPSSIQRVQIRDGRVNFKRGPDKHPFAFVNVNGSLENEGSGTWGVDLEASVFRAGISLQEGGTLQLRGRLGSTAARLRPAQLELRWRQASLADALRLFRAQDFGVRGQLELDLTASSGPWPGSPVSKNFSERDSVPGRAETDWQFSARVRLLDVHRWDFPVRPDDPDVNLLAEGSWRPFPARVEFKRLLLEGPASSIRGSGFVQWAQPPDSQLRFLSTGIALNDLLAWLRSLRSGVDADLSIAGHAGLDATVSGWPPSLARGVLATDGARIRVPGLPREATLSRTVLHGAGDKITLRPATLRIVAPAGRNPLPTDSAREQFILEGNADSGSRRFSLRVKGETRAAEEVAVVLLALGMWPDHWQVVGDARVQMTWLGTFFPFTARPVGIVQSASLELLPPVLNHPVVLRGPRLEWREAGKPDSEFMRIAMTAARAFGTSWTGSLAWGQDSQWKFALQADALDVAELERWVNPARERKSLWPPERNLQTMNGKPLETERREIWDSLRGRGQVRSTRLLVPPVALLQMQGFLSLEGNLVKLENARATIAGGSVRADTRIHFAAIPRVEISAALDRVDLAQFTGAFPQLRGKFTGLAGGELKLTMSGPGRAALLSSLEGKGQLRFVNPSIEGIHLVSSLQAADARPGSSNFRSGAAEFSIGAMRIDIKKLLLSNGRNWQLEGLCDFSQNLDLSIETVTSASRDLTGPESGGGTGQKWKISGTLEKPVFSKPSTSETQQK